MIYGDKKRKVLRYRRVEYDRYLEAPGLSRFPYEPQPGEEFYGCPWGWVDDHSPPFIEVVRDGKVIKTVNALHLAEIDFAHEPENPNP